MNRNYMLAGAISIIRVLLCLELLLILAWHEASFMGADFRLLPRPGTPWQRRARVPMPVPAA